MTRRRHLEVAVFAAAALLLAAPGVCAQEGTPQAPAAPVRWTLADVVASALEHHPAVGLADADARAAAARRGQVGSIRLPQVDANASLTRSEQPSPVSGEQSRETTSVLQGTVSQLLTDFGRTGAAVRRADDLAAAAGQFARLSRVDVVFSAQVAYFNVLRTESVLFVRRETVLQRDSLRRQAQAFFEAGLRAKIDVVRAEANYYQARADAAGAEHDARTARLVLLNRMGVDGPADFQLAGAPEIAEAAGTIEDWHREALERRPDLLGLRLQLAAARNALLAADRGANPSLTATGRLGWAGDELPSDRSWGVGVQVNLPVFDGRLTHYQSAEAEALLASAEFALGEQIRQVRLEVEEAEQAMRDAAERLAAREKEREAFAENLRLATGRYEAGAADIIEMVDAQLQMTAAETNLVNARFDRVTALAALYRSLGRLPADR